jgi:hypothetical protein
MRVARSIVPGVVYHIISRFVEGEWRLRDDAERAHYLRLFGTTIQKSDWLAISYALMSNHVHHALVAGNTPIGTLFKRVHSPFANWINERQGRIGPVFAERAKVWAIRPEHVAHLVSYIHNNPLRAGVVSDPLETTWTSLRAHVGLDPAPSWLALDECRARGIGTAEACLDDPEVALAGIQREARRRGAVQVATPTLSPIEVPIVCRPFARIRPRPEEVLEVVAQVTGLISETFRSRSSDRAIARARRLAVCGGVLCGLTASDIGAALGISRQAAARLFAKGLDDYDRPALSVVLARLTGFTSSPVKRVESHGLLG